MHVQCTSFFSYEVSMKRVSELKILARSRIWELPFPFKESAVRLSLKNIENNLLAFRANPHREFTR